MTVAMSGTPHIGWLKDDLVQVVQQAKNPVEEPSLGGNNGD